MADGAESSPAEGGERLPSSRAGILAAAAVHVFTASGIVCALMATLATLDGAYARAFAWLGLAFLIDGIDGTFARMVHVSTRLPRFSGDKLDLVVDYVTYVFVPVLMLLKAGLLSGPFELPLACLILLSSLFHFCDTESKTEDNHFVGFPAIWNLVAFYLFAIPLPRWLGMVVIAACIVMTFVPMRWLHPLRVKSLMPLNIAATLLWSAAAAWTVFVTDLPADSIARIVLGAVGVYGLALAFATPWTSRPSHGDEH
jgi:phosphatidylcholine synthase